MHSFDPAPIDGAAAVADWVAPWVIPATEATDTRAGPAPVWIAARVVRRMRVEASRQYPREACGLLGSPRYATSGLFVATVPVRNESAGPHEASFAIDPAVFYRTERKLAEQGLVIGGVYHSHPDAPAVPSAEDTQAAWPVLTYVIVPVDTGGPHEPRAFDFSPEIGRFLERPLQVLSPSGPIVAEEAWRL